MAGRFEGLSDSEWQMFADLFPTPEKRKREMPSTPFRKVLNTVLYVLITGCRWCDVPIGESWGIKECSPPLAKAMAGGWHYGGNAITNTRNCE